MNEQDLDNFYRIQAADKKKFMANKMRCFHFNGSLLPNAMHHASLMLILSIWHYCHSERESKNNHNVKQ